MKKFILLILLLFPISVNALNDSKDLYIDALVQEDGSIDVTETLSLELNTKLFHKNLIYSFINLDTIYNSTGIENVSLKYIENKEEKEFSKKYYEIDALENDYIESSIQNGKSYKMFLNPKNKYIIKLSYTLKDVIVVHDDIAELNYPIFNNYDIGIDNLTIDLKIYSDNSNNFNAWTHGDVTSKIDIKNNNVKIITKNIKANTNIYIRETLDKDIFNNIIDNKKTSNTKLQEILLIENKKEIEKNKEVLKKEKLTSIIKKVGILYIVLDVFLIGFMIYKNYRNLHNKLTSFNKSLLKKYPIYITSLLYFKYNYNKTVICHILSLIDSNILSYKNNKLTIKNNDGNDKANSLLLNLLFNKDKSININNIKINSLYYNDYCSYLDKEVSKYYEVDGIFVIISLFMLLVSIFILTAKIYFKTDEYYSIIMFISSLLLFIYTLVFKRKSKTANTIINNINLITKDMDISLPYKYLINNIDSDEYHELIDNLDNYLKKLKI